MKLKKTMSETVDSSTFKKAYYPTVCDCQKCSPNKGCNKNRKKYQKNWKKFRNTKWK